MASVAGAYHQAAAVDVHGQITAALREQTANAATANEATTSGAHFLPLPAALAEPSAPVNDTLPGAQSDTVGGDTVSGFDTPGGFDAHDTVSGFEAPGGHGTRDTVSGFDTVGGHGGHDTVGTAPHDTVPGFDTVTGPGHDPVHFAGEAKGAVEKVVATQTVHDGGVTISFADGSSLTVAGVTHIDGGFFHH
jgi:hypothetical protein